MQRENYLFECECARCVTELTTQEDVTSDEDLEEEEDSDEYEDIDDDDDDGEEDQLQNKEEKMEN